MSDRKYGIFIAQYDTIMRDGLRTILGSEPDFEIVGEASDGMAVIRAVEKVMPDIILMDLRLPKMSGIAALRSIRKKAPKVKILFLTDDDREECIIEVLRMGGNGYCLKDITGEELIVAIRNILSGKSYISPGILHSFLSDYLKNGRNRSEGPLHRLSFREQDILKLIGEGHTIGQIAQYLFISRRTAETHRYNIMKKLDLHRTSELVSFAIENRLVTNR